MPRQESMLVPGQEQATALDAQILELQKVTDYEIREYPIEVIVEKFTKGLELDEAELFVPDYQREMIWTPKQQSRFIESIFMNLPIPYVFVADVAEGRNEARLEIVDGSQRIRTLVNFVTNRLTLVDLERVDLANGFRFCDLTGPRQLRFKRKTIRMIELTERADEEARREMFDRLNSGGTKLKEMEKRRGTKDGEFLTFLKECANEGLLRELCPVSKARQDRKEYEELVLRYFAYCENYKGFNHSVNRFLDDYLDEQNKNSTATSRSRLRQEFERMLQFVGRHFPYGFRKGSSNTSVPRIRFEALAVGITLALREDPLLEPTEVSSWLDHDEFTKHTRSDASNSRPKVVNRVHYVRDHLLDRPVEYDDKTVDVENSENADAPIDDEQSELF